MLIRITGGREGLRIYLEEGRKAGREFTRDQMDERVVLVGSLERFEEITSIMENEGEKYLHLTFAMREDDLLPPSTKRAIVEEFERFAFSAYEKDEYYVYAEAHYPKIKEYTDANGKTVHRMQHTHLAIPRYNLVTGQILDPFGKVDRIIEYINAFQEHINAKYGLASPKAHPRLQFTPDSEMISRIKGDLFTGNDHEYRQAILDAVVEQGIENFEDFQAMLARDYGETRIPKSKAGEFINVHPTGKARGINLKDPWFRRDFIELPTEEKRARLAQARENEQANEEAALCFPGLAAPTPEECTALLDEWHNLKAREVRYVNSGNKKFFAAYSAADRAEKLAMLDAQQKAWATKHRPTPSTTTNEEQNEHTQSTGRGRSAPPATRGKVQNLSALGVVHDTRRGKVLLQDHVSPDLDNRGTDGHRPLRRSDVQVGAAGAGDENPLDPKTALAALTATQSVFSYAQLENYVRKHTGEDDELFAQAFAAIIGSDEIAMCREGDRELYTSREVLNIEMRLVHHIDKMLTGARDDLPPETREKTASTRKFNAGQAQAFGLLTSGNRIVATNGAAGTGKSYVLSAMRECFEAEGYTLHGALLQGKTAADLERDSGIKSQTMHSFLSALDGGYLVLSPKSVVVIDEAGMIGSRQMTKLLEHINAAGAMLRMVGDAKQLPAVEFGNAFEVISDRVPLAKLTEIMRQEHDWMREASEMLSRHEIAPALQAYAEHGCVHQAATAAEGRAIAINKWTEKIDAAPGEKPPVVIVKTNAERRDLNILLRRELKSRELLGEDHTLTVGDRKMRLAVGESISFLQNDYDLNVMNGTAGKIEAIEGNMISVRVPDGRLVDVDLQAYGEIDYAYALTIYKTQGITDPHAIVMASRAMTAEDIYVAMTRHKGGCDIVYSAEDAKDLETLAKHMSRSAGKEFTVRADALWTSVGPDARPVQPAAATADPEALKPARPVRSVVDSLIAEADKAAAQRKAEEKAEWREISKNLDAARLLAHLSHSHGVRPEQFEVTKGKDGGDRIRIGTRNLSVGDFLTQHMSLSWREAAPILRETYAMQQGRDPVAARQTPSQRLWKEFYQWRQTEGKAERDAAWSAQKAYDAARRLAIKDNFHRAKSAVHRQQDPRKNAERRAAVSILRMERIEAEDALRDQIAAEHAELKAIYNKPPSLHYRDWLASKAEAGNVDALVELRRQQPPTPGRAAVVQNHETGYMGRVVAHGTAPYLHDADNSKSYYVTLAGANGETRTVWGVDLERAMTEYGIDDYIALQFKGKQNVEVVVTVTNEHGERVNETRVVTRNTWQAEAIDAQEIEQKTLANPTTEAGIEDPLIRNPTFSYTVAANGDVTYSTGERPAIRDAARAVQVLTDTADIHEKALRLAVQKFGPKIAINGTDEFKRSIATVAAERRLHVEFAEPEMQAMYLQAAEEVKARAAKPAPVQAAAAPAPAPAATAAEAAPVQQHHEPQQTPQPQEIPTMDQAAAPSGGKRRTAAEIEAERQEAERKFRDAVQRAKDCDLPEELKRLGVELKADGTKGFKIANGGEEADRLFVSKQGNWMVYTPQGARQYTDAIDYYRTHSGQGYRDAVLTLAKESDVPNVRTKPAERVAAKREDKVTEIHVRAANAEEKRVVSEYAQTVRGISRDTLIEAWRQGVIKQDNRGYIKDEAGNKIPCGPGLAFLGYDEKGRVRNAETRLVTEVVVDGKPQTKVCYAGTDKTYPPIYHGSSEHVAFVEGGYDALALIDMHKREGREAPTTIITGGARTLKWEENAHVQDLIKNASVVEPWGDNEITIDGQGDAKKQAETDEAHRKQMEAILRIRGNAQGVTAMRPPAGVKDLAAWNKREALRVLDQQRQQQEHQQQQQVQQQVQQQQRQEDEQTNAPRP